MADIIDELAGLDDAALSNKLGFADKVKEFKEDLARAAKLTGKPREKVMDTLEEMFKPQDYMVGSFHHAVERQEEKANGKTTPSDMAACACGMSGEMD